MWLDIKINLLYNGNGKKYINVHNVKERDILWEEKV